MMEEDRVFELERDIRDIIPRFKGCYNDYTCTPCYEFIRRLKALSENLTRDCDLIINYLYKDQYRNDDTRH